MHFKMVEYEDFNAACREVEDLSESNTMELIYDKNDPRTYMLNVMINNHIISHNQNWQCKMCHLCR